MTKKTWLIGFSVALVVMLCILSGMWAIQAFGLRHVLKEKIAELNQRGEVLTYESMGVGGFPYRVTVTLEKPRYKGNAGAFFKAMGEGQPQTSLANKIGDELAAKALQGEFYVDGNMRFSVDIFSSHYVITSEGTVQTTLTTPDFTDTLTTTYDGPVTMETKLKKNTFFSGQLWSAARLAETPPAQLYEQLRGMQYSTPAGKVTSSGVELVNTGPVSLGVAFERSGTAEKITGELKVESATATPAYDALIDKYTVLSPTLRELVSTSSLAQLGTYKADMAFAFNTEDRNAKSMAATAFSLSLPRMEFTSALFTHKGELSLSNAPSSSGAEMSMKLYSESSFTPQYETMYRRNIEEALKASPPSGALCPADQLASAVVNMAPKLSALSTQVLRVEGKVTEQSATGGYSLDLKDFTWSTPPYAISMSGTADMLQPTLARFALSCRNCTLLVDDTASFLIRLRSALECYDPSAAKGLAFATPQLAMGVKSFINEVGERSQDETTKQENYLFRFAGAEQGFTLNGKTAEQLSPLFQQHIAPHLNNH